jgi:hypothetical protein
MIGGTRKSIVHSLAGYALLLDVDVDPNRNSTTSPSVIT